jgi:FkbM family methyltransferase
VLKHFCPWQGIVPARFFADFLGNRTRSHYWAFPGEIRRLYDHERFEAFSAPSIGDNIFDWLILLEAVVEARGGFTMAALGSGWGRWLVAGAFAAAQLGRTPCRLVGVEAEPTHFQWMLEHFRDNNLDPNQHELIEAAAGARSGRSWFYVGKSDSWYGQSLIHDKSLEGIKDAGEIEYGGERARMVRTVDFAELSRNYPRIDYLHLDIQGAELDVLSADPRILDAKVKRVLVGTHSAEIEAGLRKLFGKRNWRCQYDFPMNSEIQVDGTGVTLGDGVQAWINPNC